MSDAVLPPATPVPPRADGREWLSVYLFFDGWIYAPDCDRVVLDVVEPFVRRCQAEGWIHQHFFIRYSEFGPHVRLRLLEMPDVLSAHVWPALVEHVRAHNPDVRIDEKPETPGVPKREEGQPVRVTHVARVEYEPETDRYGGPDALLVSERAFQVSSDTAYALIAKMGTERSSRLGKGLLGTVILIHLFADSREQGSGFTQMYSTNYLRAMAREEDGREALLQVWVEEGNLDKTDYAMQSLKNSIRWDEEFEEIRPGEADGKHQHEGNRSDRRHSLALRGGFVMVAASAWIRSPTSRTPWPNASATTSRRRTRQPRPWSSIPARPPPTSPAGG